MGWLARVGFGAVAATLAAGLVAPSASAASIVSTTSIESTTSTVSIESTTSTTSIVSTTSIESTTSIVSTTSATSTVSIAAAARTASTAPVTCRHVFLSPHQDDEVLTMGAAIRSRIEKDGPRSVCVALFTTGERSMVRARFGGRGFVPAGRTTPYVNERIAASTRLFRFARDREFIAASRALGVPAANIYLDQLPGWARIPDWNTPDRTDEIRSGAERFVDAAIARFGPDAAYATTSDVDPSPDHTALGRALRDRSHDVRSVDFYYPQYQLSLLPADVDLSVESAAGRAVLRRAAAEYGLFKPAAGRYGIGWLSAARGFGAGALGVKIWSAKGWTSSTPFAAQRDRSFLTTLRSYRHS